MKYIVRRWSAKDKAYITAKGLQEAQELNIATKPKQVQVENTEKKKLDGGK